MRKIQETIETELTEEEYLCMTLWEEVELTKDECKVLREAEQLLKNMKKEIDTIPVPRYLRDEEKVTDCLESIASIARRYNVYATLGVDEDEI